MARVDDLIEILRMQLVYHKFAFFHLHIYYLRIGLKPGLKYVDIVYLKILEVV